MAKTATKLDRTEVVNAALDLVVREGPAALTMRRLATDLDVGTPTIYWHVGSRDELVAEVVRAQAERLAERPVEGTTARARVLCAAVHIYEGAIEQRSITSLAHQTGTSNLLLSRLEETLDAELQAAGLTEAQRTDALRSLLLVITGALVLTLRGPAPGAPTGSSDATDAADPDPAAAADPAMDATWDGCDLGALTRSTLAVLVAEHLPEEGP